MKKEENKPDEKGDELRNHLKDEFQRMKPKTAAPEALKKQVFDTLDAFQLIADMADLFTVKFTKTESQMMEMLGDRKQAPPDETPPDTDTDENK